MILLINTLKYCANAYIPIRSSFGVKNVINYTARKFQIENKLRSAVQDVNTNVIKDVVLFKYENPRFFKLMNLFAVSQYIFWSYLGYFAYTSMKDAPVDSSKLSPDAPWYRKVNLGDNKYRNTLAAISVLLGGGSLCIIWMYTLKSVRLLILNKGGKHITFVTYAPFGHNRIMKVPLNCISCKESRTTASVQLPLKVKNKLMHYMLDMRGEFTNTKLFDNTAGLKRYF